MPAGDFVIQFDRRLSRRFDTQLFQFCCSGSAKLAIRLDINQIGLVSRLRWAAHDLFGDSCRDDGQLKRVKVRKYQDHWLGVFVRSSTIIESTFPRIVSILRAFGMTLTLFLLWTANRCSGFTIFRFTLDSNCTDFCRFEAAPFD